MLTPLAWIASSHHRGGAEPTPQQVAVFCAMIDQPLFVLSGEQRTGKSALVRWVAQYSLYRIHERHYHTTRGLLSNQEIDIAFIAMTKPEAEEESKAVRDLLSHTPYFQQMDASALRRLIACVHAYCGTELSSLRGRMVCLAVQTEIAVPYGVPRSAFSQVLVFAAPGATLVGYPVAPKAQEQAA